MFGLGTHDGCSMSTMEEENDDDTVSRTSFFIRNVIGKVGASRTLKRQLFGRETQASTAIKMLLTANFLLDIGKLPQIEGMVSGTHN